MNSRKSISFGLIVAQIATPLVVAAVVLSPVRVFASDQSIWATCAQRALQYVVDIDPGLTTVQAAMNAVRNNTINRGQFSQQYGGMGCANENFALDQDNNISDVLGGFDPVNVVNKYQTYRSAAQATADGAVDDPGDDPGGGGGGDSGADRTEWLACVDTALRALAARKPEIPAGATSAAILDLVTADSASSLYASFTVDYRAADCHETRYAQTVLGGATDANAVKTFYNNVQSGGGGDSGDDPDARGCGDLNLDNAKAIFQTKGVSYMFCQMIVVARNFLSAILGWLGVPEGLTNANIGAGGGGIGSDPGAGGTE